MTEYNHRFFLVFCVQNLTNSSILRVLLFHLLQNDSQKPLKFPKQLYCHPRLKLYYYREKYNRLAPKKLLLLHCNDFFCSLKETPLILHVVIIAVHFLSKEIRKIMMNSENYGFFCLLQFFG